MYRSASCRDRHRIFRFFPDDDAIGHRFRIFLAIVGADTRPHLVKLIQKYDCFKIPLEGCFVGRPHGGAFLVVELSVLVRIELCKHAGMVPLAFRSQHSEHAQAVLAQFDLVRIAVIGLIDRGETVGTHDIFAGIVHQQEPDQDGCNRSESDPRVFTDKFKHSIWSVKNAPPESIKRVHESTLYRRAAQERNVVHRTTL